MNASFMGTIYSGSCKMEWMSRERRENLPNGRSNKLAFTIGYEGRDVLNLIAALRSVGIEQLIDVRERPISRKEGFSKKSLDASLRKANIHYVHLGGLGSPSRIRYELRENGDVARFIKKYEDYLDGQGQLLELLEALVETKPSAVMCFERDWKACHRSVLSQILEKNGFGLAHL